MAINFPTSLDTTSQPSAGQVVDSARIAKLIQMVEALEAKVGADSSAVSSSLDYKVAHASSSSEGGTWPASAQGFKCYSFDPAAISTGAQTLVTGTAYVCGLYMPVASNVTNLYCINTNTGATTNAFMALYSGAGALLQTSSNQGGAMGAAGLKTFPVSSQAVPVGLFYVILWMSTALNIACTAGVDGFMNINLSVANSRYATANTGLTTTAPGTIGTKTAMAKAFWAGVS